MQDIEKCYRQKGGEFWVALLDGKVIGTIGLMLKDQNCAIMKKIFGKKEFRSQKVGLALYKKLLEFAKVAGVHHIILDTPSVAIVSHGIIGSSDLDQAGKVKAGIMTALMVKVTYNFIHTGKYRSKFMQKRFKKQMEDPNPYNRAFVAMTGIDRYDMSFITKESLKNQFKSDLITPLPEQIDNGETQIHVFCAKKMGENIWKGTKKYFKSPIIYEQDMRHEELLGVYSEKWCAFVKKICL